MTFDIMMPFYGREDHFKSAVSSVLAQDDPDWRLVVIDDHYPDEGPGRWLVSIGDPRIDYVRQPQNVGINANFQQCIDMATGDWLTIFGCDDIMLPNYVSRVKDLISSYPDSTWIQPGVRVINGDGQPVSTLVDRVKSLYRPKFDGTLVLRGERLATSITRGNWMYFPALAWRRSSITATGFRANLTVVQDLALALDLALDGAAMAVDDTIVFEYRRHESSVSSWRAVEGSRFVEEQQFFHRMATEFGNRGWPKSRRAAKLHLSSRLNAATRLPDAIKAGHRGSMQILLRHILGFTATPTPRKHPNLEDGRSSGSRG